MSGIIEPRTLSGFMELLPKDQVLFDKIKAHLESVYLKYGFFPLDTPVLEDSAILLAKAGGETEKQIYRFSKGSTDLTMRFDLTVPLAKYVAKNYGELTFPFRRYQIGKVYRGERAQKGRYREFYQADIDIIGDGTLSIANDAEIPSIIYSLFLGLGIDDFVIRINNRKVLSGIFAILGIKEAAADILRIIDKLDKIGKDAVFTELTKEGILPETAEKLLTLLTTKGENEKILEMLNEYKGQNELFDKGICELETVIKYIGAFGVPSGYYTIDLTIARGLDYYTGTVYETFIRKHPEYGSVCSGGRYDNLAEYYTKKSLPGVGISIGLTRLFHVLWENEFLNRQLENPVDALVLPMSEDLSYSLEVATGLREAGISTQVYLEEGKFKKKISYSDKLSIPFSIILGSDEEEAKKVALKNMSTGEQVICTLSEAVKIILENKEELKKAKKVIM
ncbi:MAG: histidine--tRNA ligase [Ruminococcaceae bacterium]|nr:histidine--tRNA ligase [Oscillospiraceae bacterium]